ncbi:MAG: hypothetical protein ACTSYG_10795 [Candidatus Heimdallarchaeota archaeon]
MPEKLKKIFVKTYAGKPVPKKYQAKYGKVYSKKEAERIFYATQQKRKKRKSRKKK